MSETRQADTHPVGRARGACVCDHAGQTRICREVARYDAAHRCRRDGHLEECHDRLDALRMAGQPVLFPEQGDR